MLKEKTNSECSSSLRLEKTHARVDRETQRGREGDREREANVKNFPLEKEIFFGSTHRMMHPSLPFSRNKNSFNLKLICSLDHFDG